MSSTNTPGYGQASNYLSPRVNFGWISEAFEIYRTAWLPWLCLYLIPVAAYILFMVLSVVASVTLALSTRANKFAPPTNGSPALLVVFALGELLIFCSVVLVIICSGDIALRQVKGEIVEVRDILRGVRTVWNFLLFGLLSYIAALVGILALFVGTYVVLGFLIPGNALIADEVPVMQTFSKCIEGMKRDWLNATLFYFIVHLALGVGVLLTCGFGAFAAYPMLFIISALAYRDMIGIPIQRSPYELGGAGGSWGQSGQTPGVWPPAPSTGQSPYFQQPGQYGQQPFGQTPPDPTVPPGT